MQLCLNLIVFRIYDKVVAFETGGPFPAKIRPDQIRKLAYLPVPGLESIPAVILLQPAQVKVDDDGDLPLLPDPLNTCHRRIEEPFRILQPCQTVIVFVEFNTFRCGILVRQSRQHRLDNLIAASVRCLIGVSDESDTRAIHRDVLPRPVNQTV